jgi:Uncharacterized conserved protein
MRNEKDESTSGAILGAIHPEIQRRNVASGHRKLIELIRAEIAERGALSFARFMELALYHPDYGYYASGRANIGRAGDFFTNVSVGSCFGYLLAAQFAEVWQQSGSPSLFTIVEQGAHDALFASDALTALSRFRTHCFNALHYIVIEPFSIWRERQKKTLAAFQHKVHWVQTVDELESFSGIYFANELFDAVPVHLITSGTREEPGNWQERRVTAVGDHFELVSAPIRDPELRAQTDRLGSLPPDFRTEINLAAPDLMCEVAGKLSQGVILTIDYGFPRAQFYSQDRNEGTLQIRSGHRKLSSPFEKIGRADISAHVEWTSLAEAAEQAGASLLGFADQYHFFTGIIADTAIDMLGELNKQALQTLLHPELLGRSFQALALAENFGGSLSGYRYSREPRAELGMTT